MGRAANQDVNDSSEFTVTGSHLIDPDRQGDPPVMANSRVSAAAKRTVPTGNKARQATFSDASRVFVLNVQNREANQALPGQRPIAPMG
jgi:hypothetical protein